MDGRSAVRSSGAFAGSTARCRSPLDRQAIRLGAGGRPCGDRHRLRLRLPAGLPERHPTVTEAIRRALACGLADPPALEGPDRPAISAPEGSESGGYSGAEADEAADA